MILIAGAPLISSWNYSTAPTTTKICNASKYPYGTGHLHGLRLRPATPSNRTIVIHAGFDAYVEEFYSFAKAITLGGFEIVMFDGPGQGSTLMCEKMPMTHEWEKPVGAVLDHMGLTDATLIGISLGGYLAIRAAALEPRVKRVIQCIASRRGKLVEGALKALVRLGLSTPLDMMAARLMKRDLYSKWGIQQGMHVTGAASPSEYLFQTQGVPQPRNLSSGHPRHADHGGAEDHFVPLQQFFDQLQLLVNARSVTAWIFTRADQAQSHCQIGNLGLAVSKFSTGWIRMRDHVRFSKMVSGNLDRRP